MGLPSQQAWAEGVKNFANLMEKSEDRFPSDVTDTRIYPRAEDMPLQTYLRARYAVWHSEIYAVERRGRLEV